MKIIISGGTGLIGSEFIKNHLNDEIFVLSRSAIHQSKAGNVNFLYWDGKSVGEWASFLNNADVVINLSGENIGKKRWNDLQKKKIVESRVNAGNAFTKALSTCREKPKLFIQASAVGYYGTSLDLSYDEGSAPGNDFLSGVGKAWEDSINGIQSLNIRTVVLRLGVVLSQDAGVFPKLVFPIRNFIGGPLGRGNQWISWVHIKDVVRAMDFMIDSEFAQGVYNITGPQPVRNKEIGAKIASILRCPYFFSVPSIVLKILLGEMSTLVLDGQKVKPEKLLIEGFKFDFPDIDQALMDLLH